MEMWVGIFLLILLVLIVFFSKSESKRKGNEGERIVKKRLNRLKKSKYTIINDVSFSINGKISQIDHLVVSNFGIFVIETKNYKGMIFGRENDSNWIQVLGRHKNQFYSPIRQNLGHIYALKHVLREYNVPKLESIVVFTNRGELKVKSTTPVIHPRKLLKQIRRNNKEIICDELKSKLIQRIKEENLNHRRILVKLKKAS